MNKIKLSLSTRLILTTSIMLSLIILSGFGVVYYYSYQTYAKNFEDYVIDERTTQDYLNKGIKNEWVLGTTAHSIDLVKAIHGDHVAEILLKKAEKQVEASKFYREQIDGKYLYYRIKVDLKNGERIYKYSIIKDIYLEQIPNILRMVIILIISIFGLTYLLLKSTTKQLLNNIRKTTHCLNRVAAHDLNIKIDRDKIFNKDMAELVDSFENMQNKLKEQHELQESILQYISHEMKTPIMIINCYTESAKEGIYPKGQNKSLYDLILKQTERMSTKINELLLTTKVDTDFTSGTKKVVNLSEIFYNVYNNLNKLNPNIDKSIELNDNLFSEVYPQNIEVLFENLLINAFKYAKSNIRIRATTKEDNIVFNFFNDGDKISEKNLKNIFKPFVKGENGGTGLGLTICKKIVMMYNGDISCVSNNNYTVFIVTLPYTNKSS
ncbi:ATP-binding protein [Haloimpatiens sp. FM7315]|uniref:HAMP domain-containing sensor histidine kinase n=1 Tax=Haloimpatiens sp. FM7315 TaxID=3298609 RepID=UPI0035A2665D